MSAIVPNVNSPLVDEDRTIADVWLGFLRDLVASPGAIASVTAGSSPFTYSASDNGHVHVRGGAVTSISLIRGRVSLTTGVTAGFVPVSSGDSVTITYSAAPTVSFVPC